MKQKKKKGGIMWTTLRNEMSPEEKKLPRNNDREKKLELNRRERNETDCSLYALKKTL